MATKKKTGGNKFFLLIGLVLAVATVALFAVPFISVTAKAIIVGEGTATASGFAFAFGIGTLFGGDEAVVKAALDGFNGTLVAAYGVNAGLTKAISLLLFLNFIVIVLTVVAGLLNFLGILKNRRITAVLAALSILIMLVSAILVFVLVGKMKEGEFSVGELASSKVSTLVWLPFVLNLLSGATIAYALKK